MSSKGDPFWAADLVFGIFLVALAVLSVLWHASNAKKSHYLDLWTMDTCIVYLIVRFIFMGIWKGLSKLTQDYAQSISTWGCFISILLVVHLLKIEKLGSKMKHLYGPGPLDVYPPFCVRRRLLQLGSGDWKMSISDVFKYLLTPFFFMAIPLLMIVVIGSVGSVYAGQACMTSLVVGWTFRGFERFMLDGWPLINMVKPQDDGEWTTWRLLLAALFSPTAILHWCTGITLLYGFAWTRSIDKFLLIPK